MFDLGFYEFIIVGFVLFLVLPTKDFPKTIRWMVRAVQNIKNGISDFFSQFSEPMDEFNNIRDELKKESDSIKKSINRSPAKIIFAEKKENLPDERD